MSANNYGTNWKTFGTIGTGTSTYGVRQPSSTATSNRYMFVIVQAAADGTNASATDKITLELANFDFINDVTTPVAAASVVNNQYTTTTTTSPASGATTTTTTNNYTTGGMAMTYKALAALSMMAVSALY